MYDQKSEREWRREREREETRNEEEEERAHILTTPAYSEAIT